MHLFALCKYPSVLPFGAGMAGKPKLCSKNRAIHCYAMGLKVMKITAVILLATCLQAAAAGYGQKVTISEKDAPVEKIFSLIRKQTGFQFLYANQVLAEARKVTIQVKNAELEDVLAATFQGQPFEYHIKDKTIIVRMRPAPQVVAEQPPVDVRGRVVNAQGEPVAGATITVEGTKRSTITNANGEFTLTGINDNAILQISHVQYEGEAIVLNGRSTVNATLQVKVSSLDEMQVIAYGQTKKRFQTGNVSTIKSRDIERQPVTNPLLTLQGRVAGVFIEQASGLPNAGVKVRIQGQNSISKGNDPLYVIDGVPYTSQFVQPIIGVVGSNGSGIGSPLSYINPADIESIEILKDADATAIYGSRAANGAILITTKKGKSGATNVGVNFQQGWGRVANMLPLLNTEQYMEMRQEAFKNDGVSPSTTSDYDLLNWDVNSYTDWQKELIGNTAHFTDAQLSISGGNANTTFLISTGFHRETTVFPGDLQNKKGSLHFNLNHTSANQKLNVQLSGNYQVDNNRLSNTDLTLSAISIAPNAPALHNEDGSLNWAPLPDGNSSWLNPLAYLEQKYKNKGRNLISNALVSYKLFAGFSIRSSFGYTNLHNDESRIIPLSSFAPETRPNSARDANFGNSDISSWIVEPQLVYEHKVWKGKLEALVGATIHQKNTNGQQFAATGFNSDKVMEDIRSAATVSVSKSVAAVYKYNAIFGRVNYNLQDKYIVNLSVRRDGSSAFGEKNLFHNFGAVGAAWIFSNENIIRDNLAVLSYGKLRGSYGTSGNDQIGDYQFLNLYNPYSVPVAYQGISSLNPVGLPNPYLQWEETKKLQFGLDLGFFNDRIILNTNYYHNTSSNQLQNFSLPFITGNNSILLNLPAKIRNTGLELALNTVNIRNKDIQWTTGLNVTIPKNKLVEYPGLATSSAVNSLAIGYPIALRKLYQALGVEPATGLFVFADTDDNITSTPKFPTDATVLVSPSPKYFGGLVNSFRYKSFEIEVLFQFVKQIATQNYFLGNSPGTFYSDISFGMVANQPDYVLDRWQKPGDVASHQKFSATYNGDINDSYSNAGSSSLVSSDASYIRLKNASLSWHLPGNIQQKLKIKNTRVFVQGQNLLTITNFKGIDPETRSINYLPPLKMLTAGLQMNL